jgi:hypothetical protein
VRFASADVHLAINQLPRRTQMTYAALQTTLYQSLLVLAGLLIASWGAMIIRTNVLRIAGCVVASAAGIWAAWQGIDQLYLVMHAFSLEYLKLFEVLAALIGGVLMAVIVYASTNRPQVKADQEVRL